MFAALLAETNGFCRGIHVESDAFLPGERARGVCDVIFRWLGRVVRAAGLRVLAGLHGSLRGGVGQTHGRWLTIER